SPLAAATRTACWCRNRQPARCLLRRIGKTIMHPLFPLLVCLPLAAAGENPPDVRPQHVVVYHRPGRFGGWPANHGIWSWGDEILVGFSAGYHQDLGPNRHNIDHDKPEEHLLARSKDGGRTWSIENPATQHVLVGTAGMRHG